MDDKPKTSERKFRYKQKTLICDKRKWKYAIIRTVTHSYIQMKGRIACVVRCSKDGNSQTNYIGRIHKFRRFWSIVDLEKTTVQNRTTIVT